jgi:hypothetical protein
MNDVLRDVLVEAIDDEYKARATYRRVIEKFGEVRPFINIVEAESRHVEALLPLFAKYDIEVPVDNWYQQVQVPDSLQQACQAGVDAEIDNAAMYERLLSRTEAYPDIQHVLLRLQAASAENHLPAFQRCLERNGRQGHEHGQRQGRGRRGCHR